MYLDSCVIVKLVSHEPDSAAYHAIVAGHAVVTSELAVAEVRFRPAHQRTGGADFTVRRV